LRTALPHRAAANSGFLPLSRDHCAAPPARARATAPPAAALRIAAKTALLPLRIIALPARAHILACLSGRSIGARTSPTIPAVVGRDGSKFTINRYTS